MRHIAPKIVRRFMHIADRFPSLTAPSRSGGVHETWHGPRDGAERQGLQTKQETVPPWGSYHWETRETAEDRAGAQAQTETPGTQPFSETLSSNKL